MVDFSNPLDAYLKSKGLENTPEERKKIEEDLSDLVTLFRFDEDGGYRNNRTDSLFSLEQGTLMSEDDFKALISNATEGQYDPDDLALLYSILNSDGEVGLSYDELAILANKDGEITRSSMFFALNGEGSYDAVEQVKTGSTDGTGGTGGTGDTGTTPPSDDDGSVNPPSNPPSNPPAADPNTDDWASGSTGDTNIDQLRELVYQIVTNAPDDGYASPDDVIDDWVALGKFPDGVDIEFSEDVIKELRSSYWSFSENDEKSIEAKIMATGCDRETAIKQLQDEGTIGDPITTDETEIKGVLKDDVASDRASELEAAMTGNNTGFFFGWGTNEDAINEVFGNDYSSADWVKIIDSYPNGSLVHAIDKDFRDGKEATYQQVIVDNLVAEIKKGNPDAVRVMCEQIYGATAEHNGTADKFMEILFSELKDDPETLYQISNYYDTEFGRDLKEDITGDYHKVIGFGANKTGQSYIDMIKDAEDKYGREY